MIDLKKMNKAEPLKRNVEKGLEDSEHSPMDPPSAYEQPGKVKVSYEEMHAVLQLLMDEHKKALEKINNYEKALVEFKSNGYRLSPSINPVFSDFFKYFDEELLLHNQKEEKALFPLLNAKLMEAGEHSVGENPMTAIDIMEDDHVKFIQLGALSFNLFGLATRIADPAARAFVFDTAYENARELIELLKLHIYREDVTLFPLAHKLINEVEFNAIQTKLK